MKSTDELICILADDLKPVSPSALEHRFVLGVMLGLGVSLLLMLLILGLRVDMAQALMLPAFWIKSAYNALIAITAFVAAYQLSRPDGSQGHFFVIAAAIIALLAVAAAVQITLSPAAAYPELVFGSSALHCPLLIFAFSLPIMAANVWVLRGTAPTRLRLIGFIAGIAAGAAGAWVYSWFCTENGMPFVLIWYSLGILLTGAFGSLYAPRVLRW